MAEEELVTMVVGSPTATADSHKRKLEEFELNNAAETLSESEPKSDPESAADMAENGDADESGAKRPRLEINGDNANGAVGTVSQNGRQGDEREDEPEEKEPEEEEAKQPKSEDINGVSVEGQKPGIEPLEKTTEEPASNENEKPEIESTDLAQTEKEVEKPEGKPLETTTTEEPASNENEKPDLKCPEDLEKTEFEGDEPSAELPREGDVPVSSADNQLSSDTQILSRKMEVPNDKVGVLIGKSGDTIRSLQDNSGAKIQIMRDADADPRSASRPLELVGTLENINKAERLIKGVIAEADAGGSPSLVARGFSTAQAASGGEQIEIQVPIEKVGLIIGKGGETIRNLQTRSGARVQLIQQNQSDGDQSRERIVRITGNKKQIETAREMIKDVMNQNIRPSPLSGGGYNQQGFRPRGPPASQWGPRGPHHAQSGYDYAQRGAYSSQGSQYPPPTYGNYPSQQGPRSNFGPSWEQRPPASMHGPSPQGHYNYGQQQGPDYGHPPPYSQAPAQPYGHGYNQPKYDHHPSSHHYGHTNTQPTPYGQGGTHSGYGPQDQYNKPPMYAMQQPQAPHSQSYVQPRPSQTGEVPYQNPISSTQSYVQNPPPQQSYPYAPSGPILQSYPPYGSAPTTDGYGQTPAPAAATGYPQGGGQPVAAGYNQPGVQQQAAAYPQAVPAGGFGSYPTGYAEQPIANSAATYGYQGQPDPAYGAAQVPAATYPAPAAGQSGYAQPVQTQPSYDQSAYPQYDTTGQMYGAHR